MPDNREVEYRRTAIHEALHATIAVALWGRDTLTDPVWISRTANAAGILGETSYMKQGTGEERAIAQLAVLLAPSFATEDRNGRHHAAAVVALARAHYPEDEAAAGWLIRQGRRAAERVLEGNGWKTVYALADELERRGEVPAAEVEEFILSRLGSSGAAAPAEGTRRPRGRAEPITFPGGPR